MRRVLTTGAVVVALVLGACGGGSDDSSDEGRAQPDQTDGAESPPTNIDLTVRVRAEVVGLGCIQSTAPTGVGAGKQLVVEDGAGGVLATGTFQLSRGLESGIDTCDWTADLGSVPADANGYRVKAAGDLATLTADDLMERDGIVTVHLASDGSPVLAGQARLPDPAGFLDSVTRSLTFDDPEGGPRQLLAVGLDICADADTAEARGADAAAEVRAGYESLFEGAGDASAIELRAFGDHLCPQHVDLVDEVIAGT